MTVVVGFLEKSILMIDFRQSSTAPGGELAMIFQELGELAGEAAHLISATLQLVAGCFLQAHCAPNA